MSCTAADLINIQPLVLSDTFNTWFDRTNEIIAAASAINVYDVDVGATSGGLIKETGCSGGYYNGVVTISVNPGAGIGIGVPAFTDNYNKVVIDAIRLENLGTGASANPSMDDYYIVSDVSDTRQGSAGTPKRTWAHRMLPPVVTFGNSGEGTFTIQGNLNVVGNLNVSNTVAYIDSNDLRIEDKIIELAYNRYTDFVVTGSGFTSGTFAVGATAYYTDSGTPTAGSATTIGQVRNWSYGSSTTGSIQLHSFALGGVDDIISGGKLVVTGQSYTGVLTLSSTPVAGTDFFNDELLTPAGIDIKGASADKTFLWNLRSPDAQTWNAFVANTNLGVTGSTNYILSPNFKAFGYSDSSVNNSFTYYGSSNSFTRYDVGTALTMRHSPTGSAGITFGIVYTGSTGPAVYPNVPVYDWVKYYNADQLDGAHALTTSTAWSIPVSLDDGKLHPDWIRADAIRKTFCQANHGFVKGHVVRFDFDGSLTFARANTVGNSEAIGIVESVTGSCFSVVTKGFISGLTATGGLASIYPLVTGNAYFLSPDVAGSMIANPDSGAYEVLAGEVRKAILVSTGVGSGYVVNYTGIVVGDTPSDLVYLRSVAPVGSVQPFAGVTSGIPDGWLLCDGAAKEQGEWSDLFAVIGQKHHAIATVYDSSTITLEGDTRGIASGDALTVTWATGSADIIVLSVNSTTRRVAATTSPFSSLDANTSVKVYGRTVASTVGRSVFFLPDLRRRTIFGSSSEYSSLSPSLALGAVGGQNSITLLPSNIPQHTHGLGTKVPSDPFGSANASSTDQTGEFEETGVSPTAFDTMPPYITMHWIIRSKKGLAATILTGHNHDNFYIRYDIPHTTDAGAARTLTDSDRIQFRSNAKVLRNDADDTFRGTLTITGNLFVGGVGGDTVDATIVGGMSADYINTNRAYINQSAVVKLASAQVLNITGGSNTTVKMYPALNYGLTGTTKVYDQTKRSANSRNLVVDHTTGEVSVRPLYNVSTSAPPASTSGYPEGFVWYQTGTQVDTVYSAAQNGYVELPGGIIMQWGFLPIAQMINDGNANFRGTVTFPRAFSGVLWSAQVTPRYLNYNGAGDSYGQVADETATSMLVVANKAAQGNVTNLIGVFWTAMGPK